MDCTLQTEDVHSMAETKKTKLLIVDDDARFCRSLSIVFEHGGFDVLCAANVNEALRLIAANVFDVLVSDLHMPDAGDGLTVVSAMRHANPRAITIINSAHPEMQRAAAAIVAQADGVYVKSQGVGNLVAMVRAKMEGARHPVVPVCSIAVILQEEAELTIKGWLARVSANPRIAAIDLSDAERSAHLPQLFQDLVHRLKNPLELGSHALTSPAAAEHGLRRREQGYTAAMMVEESRMLQVSIFQTLQENLHRVNFSLVLVGVMEIADEVDSQLAQAMKAYVAESNIDDLTTAA
jgi:DNA-binding response OmpR family regulator